MSEAVELDSKPVFGFALERLEKSVVSKFCHFFSPTERPSLGFD
jgi:hypothetical protein